MPTATAKIGSTVVATTSTWETVEGNIYFPPSSVDRTVLSDSNTSTHCPWKGDASYYNITVPGGNTVKDAAWYYPHAFEKAKHIQDYVAFYKSKVDVSVA
ncbi:hypothetical protein PV10_04247 [Exophiala mesophila]|uniref:DUF427 domain-containing protein n=1 Tax=Exophiala mesophila TaxID=212818 RepID=A0A0D1ZGW3_EXOME|nr:uncharacterized protein PV10_04247 [Exophiala mesophila]KIV92999.1 hypothetical protein PV10_04247 [Exophiala mesophila]